MKIAIDIDDVVLKLQEAWLQQFHPEIPLKQINCWDLSKCTQIKAEQIYKELDNIDFSVMEFCDHNTLDVLHILQMMMLFTDNEFFFLTAKTDINLLKTKTFFEKHKITLNIIQTLNMDKKEIPKSYFNYDFLIDDKGEEYLDNNRCLLIIRPWNKSVQTDKCFLNLDYALSYCLPGYIQFKALFYNTKIITSNLTLQLFKS